MEEQEPLGRMFRRAAGLPFLLSQAADQPVGVRHFLQLCLILLYPAWLVFMSAVAVLYGLLWILLWPLHSRHARPVGTGIGPDRGHGEPGRPGLADGTGPADR